MKKAIYAVVVMCNQVKIRCYELLSVRGSSASELELCVQDCRQRRVHGPKCDYALLTRLICGLS